MIFSLNIMFKCFFMTKVLIKEMFQGMLLCLIILPFLSRAGVVIIGTRVIYPETKKEVTVSLKNKGEQAALVQSWIDTGDPLALPEKTHVPFVLTADSTPKCNAKPPILALQTPQTVA